MRFIVCAIAWKTGNAIYDASNPDPFGKPPFSRNDDDTTVSMMRYETVVRVFFLISSSEIAIKCDIQSVIFFSHLQKYRQFIPRVFTDLPYFFPKSVMCLRRSIDQLFRLRRGNILLKAASFFIFTYYLVALLREITGGTS